MRVRWFLLVLLLAACGGGPDDGPDDDQSPGDDDIADDDDSAAERLGLLGRQGTATVLSGSFEGVEERYFTTEYGEGVDLCRIRYPLSSIAVRDDCEDCEWAFDLLIGAPELIAEVEPGCLATVGVDSAALGELEGGVVSYGYDPDYLGHIQVLCVDQGGGWVAVGHASWEPGSGEVSYDWQDGYHPY